MEAAVTSKGQVTLPSEMRKRLGIKKGSRIRFSIPTSGPIQLVRACALRTGRFVANGRLGSEAHGRDEFRRYGCSQGAKDLVMLAADTYVWARALLQDDKAQAAKAKAALAKARSADGVFVPLLVLAELSWILRSRWEREKVLDTLDGMLRTRGVQVESPALARKAVDAARSGATGFADHLIAEISFAFGVGEILTFDKSFARQPRVSRLH